MEDLKQAIIAFINADTWEESRRIVQQHPELLQPESDHLLQGLAMAQENERARHAVEVLRALLARCRRVGIGEAFAEKIHPTPTSPRGQGSGVAIPPGFEADIDEVQRLEAQKQRNPKVIKILIQAYKRILGRLQHGDYPVFCTAVQNNLGLAYADLLMGDRGANLTQAIACYQQALRFRTPDTAPLDYAATQNNLGNAYHDLPIGDRGSNLAQAIACYQQALRFRTPEAAPLDYAMTQNNLGVAYSDLPTGDRGENLAQAIACYQHALRFRTPEVAPLNYATTQINLGNTYLSLPTGDRGANLAQAITCY